MPHVVVILGSTSDEGIIIESKMVEIFKAVGVTWELSVLSCHRHAEQLMPFCRRMVEKGVQVFIGIAGMSAALPGAIAAAIGGRRPVIGVPFPTDVLSGLDALLSMVRMPTGIPVAVAGVGAHALNNAALLACQIIGVGDLAIQRALEEHLVRLREEKPAKICHYSSENPPQ